MERFVVVSYDIKNNKRRVKVAKTILDYGTRVQYSVFECILNDKTLRQLKEKLDHLINSKEDTVRFYCLCQSCRSSIAIIGTGQITKDEEVYVI